VGDDEGKSLSFAALMPGFFFAGVRLLPLPLCGIGRDLELGLTANKNLSLTSFSSGFIFSFRF
jgi:hypothetical protein